MENWPEYLLDYFKLEKKRSVTYHLRNGIKINVRPNTHDRSIVTDIWIRNSYSPPGFEIGNEDVILDIGAHIGTFSLYASKIAREGTVLSFEPMVDNFRILKENITLNGASNIIPSNQAVSEKSGEKTFFVSGTNTGGHSLHRDLISKSGKVEYETQIKTTTLPTIFTENNLKIVNFMKIDCEGCEYDILFGCPKDLLGRISKIVMEYHNIDENRNGNSMRNFLEKNGFSVAVKKYGEENGMLYAKSNNNIKN